MELTTLRQTLINFAGDPSKSWGQASDGWGNPTDINSGREARVSVEQADRNTARLNSGTYTQAQYDDFDRQLGQVERGELGTAVFSGDPHNLPGAMPVLVCVDCDTEFMTTKTDYSKPVRCYDCELKRLCPALPGEHIRCFWRRDDGWSMEAHGDVGFHNEMNFWWCNHNSGGNASHQGLVVRRDQEGKITKVILSTVASAANCCYDITFDLEANTIGYAVRDRRDVQLDNVYAKRTELEELDPIVLDLVVAMVPTWMLYIHRPRSANGCFA